jgi:hypothetical protein
MRNCYIVKFLGSFLKEISEKAIEAPAPKPVLPATGRPQISICSLARKNHALSLHRSQISQDL